MGIQTRLRPRLRYASSHRRGFLVACTAATASTFAGWWFTKSSEQERSQTVLDSPDQIQLVLLPEEIVHDLQKLLESIQHLTLSQQLPGWYVSHAILAGPSVSAVNRDAVQDASMFEELISTIGGKEVLFGIGEEHIGQFATSILRSGFSLDQLKAMSGGQITSQSLLRSVTARMSYGVDLSWALSSLSLLNVRSEHVTNRYGEKLQITECVRQTIKARSSYCFGFHRLIGIADVFRHHLVLQAPAVHSLLQSVIKTEAQRLPIIGIARAKNDLILNHPLLKSRSDIYRRALALSYFGHNLEWRHGVVELSLTENQYVKLICEAIDEGRHLMSWLHEADLTKRGMQGEARAIFGALCHLCAALRQFLTVERSRNTMA